MSVLLCKSASVPCCCGLQCGAAAASDATLVVSRPGHGRQPQPDHSVAICVLLVIGENIAVQRDCSSAEVTGRRKEGG